MNRNIIKPTKVNEITRSWHIVDVKDQILGRIATEIAEKLMGKRKSNFVRHLDCGDFVVIINSKYVRITGKKEAEKLYSNYSGYPGGLKQKALWQIREEKPTELLRHAVFGMLPKNKLRDRLMTRLYIYEEDKHPYEKELQK